MDAVSERTEEHSVQSSLKGVRGEEGLLGSVQAANQGKGLSLIEG